MAEERDMTVTAAKVICRRLWKRSTLSMCEAFFNALRKTHQMCREKTEDDDDAKVNLIVRMMFRGKR